MSIAPPLKWHGGKHYMASKIVAMMAPHTHYVEPFAGGLSVLLAKDPGGTSEVVNDLNGRLTNFWRVLQSPVLFEQLRRGLEAVPFSEAEWKAAEASIGDEPDSVYNAAAFFILCRQSLAGRMGCFAPLSRTRTSRGMNEQASAWIAAVDGLPTVHARLRRVAILNRPALDVIRGQDGPETLFYLDPPYLPDTRTSPDVYAHEMTTEDHRELLVAIKSVAGKVMLIGYASPLYDDNLAGWHRHTFELPSNAAGGASKARKTEVLWCNFAPEAE